MIHQSFITLMEVLIALGSLAWIQSQFKRGAVSQSCTISKVTEDGETVVFQTNLLTGESTSAKQAKLDELFSFGDARRKFIHERFQALLEAEKSKGSNLKAVE